jgi:hypothetical protein
LLGESLGKSIKPVPLVKTWLNTLDNCWNLTASTELEANKTIKSARSNVKISA